MFCWFYSCQEEMRNLSGDRFWKSRKECDRRICDRSDLSTGSYMYFFQILMFNFKFAEENEPNDNN